MEDDHVRRHRPCPHARPRAPAAPASAPGVARDIIVLAALSGLVAVAARGLAGVLGLVIAFGQVPLDADAVLARSLAFAVIGVPLAALLWVRQRRRLRGDPVARASLAWSLYVAAMSTVSLVAATWGLASAAADGIDARWNPSAFADAVVWTGVWLWHLRMRRSPGTAPVRLPTVPAVLGALYGVVIGALSAGVAVTALLTRIWYIEFVPGRPWWVTPAEALAWTAVAAAVWRWHWHSERAERATDAFACVVLVLVATVAAATTLGAFGVGLWMFIGDAWWQDEGQFSALVPAVFVGALVWAYHAGIAAVRSPQTRAAARLTLSAIGVAATAGGIAVIVDVLLGGLPVADEAHQLLRVAGIIALIEGLPVWWFAWRPYRRVTVEDALATGRRVYLLMAVGVSAVVGIVAATLIGSGLFESLLTRATPGLLDRIRAPLSIIAAAAAVFAYHVAVWLHERAIIRAAEPAAAPAIGRIVLVVAPDAAEAFALYVEEQLGAPVSTMQAAPDAPAIDPAAMVAAVEELRGVSAPRVLVVAAGDGGARIVPLAD